MEYKSFIMGYKSAKDKEAYAKKHIKTKYIPYADKLSEAKRIAELSTHVDINGKSVYKKNTPMQYYLTTLRIIILYTDLTYSDEDAVNMYDQLVSSEAINLIFANIPESEITQFKTMIDMYVADIYENERDLTSFIETKLEAINITGNQIMEALSELMVQANTQQTISDEEIMNKPVD